MYFLCFILQCVLADNTDTTLLMVKGKALKTMIHAIQTTGKLRKTKIIFKNFKKEADVIKLNSNSTLDMEEIEEVSKCMEINSFLNGK